MNAVEVSHRVVSAEESFQTHQEHLAKEKNLTRNDSGSAWAGTSTGCVFEW
jgi:predicted dithiol-disulfide oxidoreductase (DUF899 family)